MAFETTKNYILSMLGYPTVSVELTDNQLNFCIKESARKWFEYRRPQLKYFYLHLNQGQTIYDLPQEIIDTKGEQGIKIMRVIGNPSQFESFQYLFQYQLYNYKPLKVSNIYMLYSNLETFQQSLGQFLTWDLVEGDKIRIAPIPMEVIDVAVVYSTNDPDSRLDDNPFIWKYSFAKAKQVLGRIRGKFTIPAPNGGDQGLNGNELIAEGKEEEKELIAHLEATQEPMPIIIG